ncbi:GntR family transcriptional regulator [Streptomyces sp. NPDC060198]|uniref:GntR family transcriptional regulator n=1 Tax=Streptomyces sp. NPDC060198 TaxID=3347070 RepID=UPI0036586231
MLVRIDPASSVPLSDQIAASVRRSMASGNLRIGDRLPSARALAASLSVNVHTVLRGYQALKTEGLIELRPGRGAVVTAFAPESRALLIEHCRQAARLAHQCGLSDEETLAVLRACLANPSSGTPVS